MRTDPDVVELRNRTRSRMRHALLAVAGVVAVLIVGASILVGKDGPMAVFSVVFFAWWVMIAVSALTMWVVKARRTGRAQGRLAPSDGASRLVGSQRGIPADAGLRTKDRNLPGQRIAARWTIVWGALFVLFLVVSIVGGLTDTLANPVMAVAVLLLLSAFVIVGLALLIWVVIASFRRAHEHNSASWTEAYPNGPLTPPEPFDYVNGLFKIRTPTIEILVGIGAIIVGFGLGAYVLASSSPTGLKVFITIVGLLVAVGGCFYTYVGVRRGSWRRTYERITGYSPLSSEVAQLKRMGSN